MSLDVTLHVHGQGGPHDSVTIVGTTKALEGLAKAIAQTLHDGAAAADMMAADGEGFRVVIVRENDDEAWNKARRPYSDEMFHDHRSHAEMPYDKDSLRPLYDVDTILPPLGKGASDARHAEVDWGPPVGREVW